MFRKVIVTPLTCGFIKSFKLSRTQYPLKFINLLNYNTAASTLNFNSDFSPNEEEKILSTINKSNNEELGRYNIPQSRIKKIQTWKSKMGPFKSLNQILEVDTFSENVLKQLCNKIIHEDGNADKTVTKEVKSKSKKTFRQLVIPGVDSHYFQDLNNVTGIYLSATGMSWAQIYRDGNTLTHWNMEHFHELPKKMSLIDTFRSAIKLVGKIPPSDIYVFENIAALSLNGQSQSILVSSHSQQQDLSAMLLTLLNTSISHNVSLQNQQTDTLQEFIENKVYFIKSRVPARLFNLLIGNEKVSAINVVSELLKGSAAQPCTPIRADFSIKTAFDEHATPNKELLGQALLLVVTFMDLFVYNNSSSWSILAPRNKKNR